LAAAAVVAKATGLSNDALPEEAEAWISARGFVVGPEFVDLARVATLRVRDAIEGEAGSEDWFAIVDRLASQLAA
jgi:hypothetical protein